MIKELKEKISELRNKQEEIYNEVKYTNDPMPTAFYDLSKNIESLEYLLWAAEHGLITC